MIELTFLGRPVPAARMTKASMWTEKAQNYLGYKHALSDAVRLAYPAFILNGPHPSFKKERARYLKQFKGIKYKLYVEVYEEKETGDWDNYGKTVSDALQHADVIINDKKIKDGQVKVFEDPINPRVEFRLEVL